MSARGWALATACALLTTCGAPRSAPAPAAAPLGQDGSSRASPAPLDAGVGAEPAPPSAAPPPPPALEIPAGALDAFFFGLRQAQERTPRARVLVSVFGDSHTAGDRLTARLRHRLGERFGDAGRGLVAVGKPATRHYYQTEVQYGSAGKWKVAVGGKRSDEEPFGLAGLRLWTRDRRARGFVETCADCPGGGQVARFELLYWTGPGAARVRAKIDDGPWRKLPRAPSPPSAQERALAGTHASALARASLEVPPGRGSRRLTVEAASSGTLALFGVAIERDRPGVIVDGLGVVGRTAVQLASWDWRVIGLQLAQRAPRLVVLQYGTNEADNADLPLADIARAYDALVPRIRAAAPDASLLLLGPPDMAARAAGKACDKEAPPPRVDDLGALPPECQWRTPARLLEIVEVQRAAARRHSVAFFDSLAALGGPDRMAELVAAEPPLAFRDHVHFTAAGYERWADALIDELLRSYEAWRDAPATPQAVP